MRYATASGVRPCFAGCFAAVVDVADSPVHPLVMSPQAEDITHLIRFGVSAEVASEALSRYDGDVSRAAA